MTVPEAPLDETGCAIVVADRHRIAVLTPPPTGADLRERLLRSLRDLSGRRQGAIGVDAVAVLGAGSESCDLTFHPWRELPGRASGPALPDLAVACAVAARLTGRVLPDRIVVASDPRRSIRLRLISPARWWSGDWLVSRPQQPSQRIAARLVLHGDLVLS